MPRYRIRFSKEGAVRFISHLDMVRTFERAIRRAALPIAFSQGFNPHPKFSFGSPLPVGVSGSDEYVDIELVNEMPTGEVLELLAKTLPRGIDIKGVRQVPDSSPAMMALIEQARFLVNLDFTEPVSAETLNRCIREFLSRTEIVVIRKTKDGKEKNFDLRPGIFELEARVVEGGAVLEMELKHGSTGNIRPEEVISALRDFCNLPVAPYGVTITRTALFGVNRRPLMESTAGSK